MNHTMRLWVSVIEIRMRRGTSISRNQFEFMPERSTIEVIHLKRQMIEYYRYRKRDLLIVFLTWIKHTTRYEEK